MSASRLARDFMRKSEVQTVTVSTLRFPDPVGDSPSLWETGRGNELPNVRGTLWAAYKGIAEHADYGLTSARDSKWLDGVWFGESYRIKTMAFDAAMQVAKNTNAVSVVPVVTQ